MRVAKCSCSGTSRARPRGRKISWLLLESFKGKGCSSLVAKYANAIGLSGCYKAGDFPGILGTRTWTLRASVTFEPTTSSEISIVSSYIYESETWLCFREAVINSYHWS